MNTIAITGTALNALALPAPALAGELARRLWVRTGRVRPVAQADRDVHDLARTEHLHVGEWEVATYAWGDGARPVLLAHGWLSRASRFAPLVRRLLDLGYSPVSWDAPGHGATGGRAGTILDAQEIIGLLQSRHGRFSAVVSHSLGALFSVHALRQGIEADRLVLVSGVADFEVVIAGFTAGLRLRPRTVAGLRTAIERYHFAGDTTVWTRFDAVHEAHTLTQPVLLLHDQDDPMIPHAQSRRMLAAFGDRAALVTTSGLRHNGILTDGDSLDRITAFVQGAPVASP
ncbi:alpha-beta hydrolase superfamily lysophospholipase [Nocardiopsis sp. Huas11]|uniref:alpha/beta hydrolase n=1 Tax=Nocardiopsis sp. Huas11 TaxID=2183912 RepID=UPI000EAE8714|nr:alpha/beta fold hydrolase [Nocardiopsis sp. Huas11]RKS07898.1 alpha-beta hydrolase superfamily lysophospholipase [Nocardiopsis sp. Huas11]